MIWRAFSYLNVSTPPQLHSQIASHFTTYCIAARIISIGTEITEINKKTITIALPALMLSAAPLLAETNYMSGALSYDRWSADGGSLSQTNGTLGYEGTNGKLTYGLELDVTRISGGGPNTSLIQGTISAGYAFTQNFTLLGSYSRSGFSDGPSDDLETFMIGG